MLVGSIAVLAALGFSVPFAAQGSTERTGQPTTAERALLSFSVFTDAARPSIYEDTRTWLQDGVWPDTVVSRNSSVLQSVGVRGPWGRCRCVLKGLMGGRHPHNGARPHSSLDYRPPAPEAFAPWPPSIQVPAAD